MSEKILRLVSRIPLLVFMFVAVVLTVIFVVGVGGTDDRAELLRIVNPPIVYTYVLAAIAVVLLLAFLIAKMVANPRGAVKTLVGLGLLVLVFLVAYAFSTDEPLQMANGTLYGAHPDPAVAKSQMRDVVMTDIGIITTYILLGISVLALIVTGILGFLRK